ncbi:hypothetical protein EN956_35790 [Mesorhizobium sp. M7A.F.Ca.CA.004.05.2.1]|nr:hypothetical protein EN956_35790 [Mesorhizobium sp. M7A.F.Ca.CA.004.05.2.1]
MRGLKAGSRKTPAPKLPISPQVGEMAGRPEGGAVGRSRAEASPPPQAPTKRATPRPDTVQKQYSTVRKNCRKDRMA